MRVLVTGATGFVGGRLVPALLRAGHDVVAMVRDPAGYEGPSGVEVVQGDLLESGWEDTLDGIDAAYYLVHSMGAGEAFAERDRRAARNFADAASAAGVDRVVYLGGLGAEGDDLSEHLESRREVERVLGEGEYDLTVLRAAVIIGDGSLSFDLIRQLVTRLPVMITPRWVRTPCQPIAIDDVVAYLVGVLDVPETRADTFEIGGPEVMTYESMLQETARLSGRREPVILPAPILSPGLSSRWLGLVTDVSTEVAVPLVKGLRNPVVVTDRRIESLVPIERTTFETAVLRALSPVETAPPPETATARVEPDGGLPDGSGPGDRDSGTGPDAGPGGGP
ncbi:NAD(P)H-binding protein [Haloglomus salinum]|uniref:NAD(P)H-binding protein n=1 Tax=Haloglomus salinum TaxID=2962673 RepID=UPI0020CA05F6|nr:NAD(P)H-binding protein [Haloglomus salinum]